MQQEILAEAVGSNTTAAKACERMNTLLSLRFAAPDRAVYERCLGRGDLQSYRFGSRRSDWSNTQQMNSCYVW